MYETLQDRFCFNFKGNETDEEIISLKDDNDPDTSAESLEKEAVTVSVAADVHVVSNEKGTGKLKMIIF